MAGRGRPRLDYLDTLRMPTKRDYSMLLYAALEAIISGENDVRIAFSYLTKFPASFPKGILERSEGTVHVRRVKARKLLDWLHEQGRTDITFESLRLQRIQFSRNEASFAGFDKIWLDESQEIDDDVKHQESSKEVHDAV